jgi:carboxypeptidase Taq
MSYEAFPVRWTMQEALKIYQETNKKLKAFFLAMYLHGWDSSTEAPKDAMTYRSTQLGTLSEMYYHLQTDPAYEGAIETLYEHQDELDDILRHEIQIARKNLIKTKKTPVEEYVKFNELMATIYPVYVEAKQTNNYALYKPQLLEVIEFKKKYLEWVKTPTEKGYNILLDEFEPEFNIAEYDLFFNTLKERLVPFAKKVAAKKLKYNKSFTKRPFPIEAQKAFAEYLRDVFCFDRNRTVIKESEHPFTTSNGTSDVRITTHYHLDNPASAIFSSIHEMGHGLYELQVDPKLDFTMSGGGASMAMHESQSRMMENMIGRSPIFWQTHFGKLVELFPKALKGVTVDDFVKHVNRVEKSLIRTEADELTYSIHIIVRYEIEKALFNGKVDLDALPALWNKKYKQYLGVIVPDDTQGILQDVHWSGGSFGYFPTYALGTAYAAQLYRAMEKDIDVKAAIQSGTLVQITEWLKEKVHRYGASKPPKEILKLATGEDFNPNYFVDYLIDKYTKLYEL